MSKPIDKKELDKKINRIHGATKTRFLRFEKVHQTLRKKSKAYYIWHNLRYANFVHFAVLLAVIVIFVIFLSNSLNVYRLSKINQGFVFLNNKSFVSEELSSLTKTNNGLELSYVGGSFSSIGSVSKIAKTDQEVLWQKIEYSATVPENAKISVRIKNADDPKSNWSQYFELKSGNNSFLMPQIKAKSVQIDIILEGKIKTPELQSLKLVFSYPQEISPMQKRIGSFMKAYLPIIWKKIENHYGNTIDI